MVSARLGEVLPEWEGFAHAVQARRPDAGTWCEGWTVRDVLVHQAGNAEEFHRVLAAHLSGQPVNTRSFEQRERPYRVMTDTQLWGRVRGPVRAAHRVVAPEGEAETLRQIRTVLSGY